MGFAIVAFCMTILTWLAWYGEGASQLHILIATGALWLLGAVYLTYVGGATTDDLVSVAKAVRGLPEDKK